MKCYLNSLDTSEKEPKGITRNEIFNSLFLKTVTFVIHNYQ